MEACVVLSISEATVAIKAGCPMQCAVKLIVTDMPVIISLWHCRFCIQVSIISQTPWQLSQQAFCYTYALSSHKGVSLSMRTESLCRRAMFQQQRLHTSAKQRQSGLHCQSQQDYKPLTACSNALAQYGRWHVLCRACLKVPKCLCSVRKVSSLL